MEVWGIDIVFYLFFAGLGSGTYMVFRLYTFRSLASKRRHLTVLLICFVALVVGSLFLLIDAWAGLSNPMRLLGLLCNIRSPLAWGTLFIAAFSIAILSSVVLLVKEGVVPFMLDALCFISAFFIAVYSGVFLGSSLGYPLWDGMLLPVVFLLSALSAGWPVAGLVLSPRDRQLIMGSKLRSALVIFEIIAVAVLLIVVSYRGVAGAASVLALVTGDFSPVFWVGFVVFGLVVPLLLSPLSRRAGEAGRTNGWLWALAFVVCSCIGSFSLRFCIVFAAYPIVIPMSAVVW